MIALSLFSDIGIGLSGLQTAQQEMTIVGQNEANAATPGYHAETVAVAERPLSLGGGAVVLSIDRQDDPFLDQARNQAAANQAYWQQEKTTLDELQSLLAPGGKAVLQAPIDNFFAAWNTLAANPESAAARAGVLSSAEALVAAFQNVGGALQNEAASLSEQEIATVSQINADLQSLAKVNAQILTNGTAPSLLDQRDALATDLAKLAGFSASAAPDGTLTVYDQGIPLVNRGNAASLTLNPGPPPSLTSNVFSSLPNPAGGQLAALFDLSANILPNLENELNQLVAKLVGDVNSQHQAGYDLNGNPGQVFFTGSPTLTGLALNPNLLANPSLLAASSAATTPADGSNAAAIYNLFTAGGGQSYDNLLGAAVATLGTTAQAAEHQATSAAETYTAADAAWQNISGVSLDQQAADLVLYQHAYEASAEYISAINTAFGYLLSIGQNL